MCNCQKIGNLNRKGMESFNQGQAGRAVLELKQAIELAGAVGSPIHEAKIRSNLALVLQAQGLTEEAAGQLRWAMGQVEKKIGRDNPLHSAMARRMSGLPTSVATA